jgi:hypothetical protein
VGVSVVACEQQTYAIVDPEWLQISCLAVMSLCLHFLSRSLPIIQDVLLPGESTTLTLSVYVDDPSAAILNTGPRRIEAFLVLHALLGKNYFITISGEYGKHSGQTVPIGSLADFQSILALLTHWLTWFACLGRYGRPRDCYLREMQSMHLAKL